MLSHSQRGACRELSLWGPVGMDEELCKSSKCGGFIAMARKRRKEQKLPIGALGISLKESVQALAAGVSVCTSVLELLGQVMLNPLCWASFHH